MREAILHISAEVMVRMFQTGNVLSAKVTQGLPEDARITDVRLTDFGIIQVKVASEEFLPEQKYVDVVLEELRET